MAHGREFAFRELPNGNQRKELNMVYRILSLCCLILLNCTSRPEPRLGNPKKRTDIGEKVINPTGEAPQESQSIEPNSAPDEIEQPNMSQIEKDAVDDVTDSLPKPEDLEGMMEPNSNDGLSEQLIAALGVQFETMRQMGVDEELAMAARQELKGAVEGSIRASFIGADELAASINTLAEVAVKVRSKILDQELSCSFRLAEPLNQFTLAVIQMEQNAILSANLKLVNVVFATCGVDPTASVGASGYPLCGSLYYGDTFDCNQSICGKSDALFINICQLDAASQPATLEMAENNGESGFPLCGDTFYGETFNCNGKSCAKSDANFRDICEIQAVSQLNFASQNVGSSGFPFCGSIYYGDVFPQGEFNLLIACHLFRCSFDEKSNFAVMVKRPPLLICETKLSPQSSNKSADDLPLKSSSKLGFVNLSVPFSMRVENTTDRLFSDDSKER